MQCPTSEGTLLSTIHGRDRRSLRSIGKRDLLAAKKYGTRERTYGYQRQPRWKFKFADIVYITEDDGVTEVTSYVVPVEVPPVEVPKEDILNHNRLTAKLNEMPNLCSSHIVIVIDQSASMNTCDVDNFKTRSDAVFATIALDFIGKQIDKRAQSNTQYTDVISVIEMRDSSDILISREPCTNVLYNKMVSRLQNALPRSHGMFEHALSMAGYVMARDRGNASCPLVLMFLSDGKPSDFQHNPTNSAGSQMFELCRQFGSQLTVRTLGFAKSSADFSVLQSMAEYAKLAGSNGEFEAVNLRGDGLSSVMTSISETMSQTRQMNSVLHHSGAKGPRTLRNLPKEAKRAENYSFAADRDVINSTDWIVYKEGFVRWEWDKYRKQLTRVGSGNTVAIAKATLGEGAERIVFRLTEAELVRGTGIFLPKGERLVAKECRYIEDIQKLGAEFHNNFCKTQLQATKLASKFNEFVALRCHGMHLPVSATIRFLPCSVYEVPEIDKRGAFRYILVEKRLDASRYEKWNSNNGFVKGHQSLASVFGRKQVQFVEPVAAAPMFKIAEGSDEEESDDDEVEETAQMLSVPRLQRNDIKLDHFPQAFSHYTYRYTKRTKLVCDLQGVLDTSVTPAVFELTDPVIHYRSESRRKGVFGRTDHGSKGMHTFFQTHECNDLCKLLGLASFTL